MEDFCESLLHDPPYLHAYLNQARVFWTFLQRAIKHPDAGITYCVLDGLDQCDEESKTLFLELLTRTLPYEGCLETTPTLKILVTTHTPIHDERFGRIEMDARTGSDTTFPVPNSSTIAKHYSNLSKADKVVISKALQTLASHFRPPTIEQYLSFFKENERSTVLAFLESHQTQLLVKPERIEFIDSEAWLARSEHESAAFIHGRLARHYLDLINTGLDRMNMEDLEKYDECVWISQVPPGLKYAVNHWANHVRLSKDTSQELINLILKTFSMNLPTLQKWWIMFMTWNYGISHYCDLRQHYASRKHYTLYTTPLHLFALLGLSEALDAIPPPPEWLFDDYIASRDAQGFEPLDLAILHNHVDMAVTLVLGQVVTTTPKYILATASSARLADMIFSNHDKKIEHLEVQDMEAMLWHAYFTGEPELLNNTINFILKKSHGDHFPWNNTAHARDLIGSGDYQLLLPILTVTNRKDKSQHIIEYAAMQHESRMLKEILNYDVVRNMIRGDQIPLTKALNTALMSNCVSMSTLLLNEHTLDVVDGLGKRPLAYAVTHPNIHTLVLLLAQTNLAFDKGTIEEGVALNLMLHEAGVEADIEQLINLLNCGARMRYEHVGMTALHVAAEIGRTEIMKALLDYLTDVEIANDIDRTCSICHGEQGWDGKTALAIASMRDCAIAVA